jgi:hypothetical protein
MHIYITLPRFEYVFQNTVKYAATKQREAAIHHHKERKIKFSVVLHSNTANKA